MESTYQVKCKGGSNSTGPGVRAETHKPLLDPLRIALVNCPCQHACSECKRLLRVLKEESKGYGQSRY